MKSPILIVMDEISGSDLAWSAVRLLNQWEHYRQNLAGYGEM
jgi:hypothetical protein